LWHAAYSAWQSRAGVPEMGLSLPIIGRAASPPRRSGLAPLA